MSKFSGHVLSHPHWRMLLPLCIGILSLSSAKAQEHDPSQPFLSANETFASPRIGTALNDTIVVDVHAFPLNLGAMLRGLLKSVPGCEVRDDDQIFMNGRKVDYISLDGENFFKRNNSVLLDNLPYYTITHLEFYNKLTNDDRDYGKTDFVMNIVLFSSADAAWLGNLTAGYGTHQRWSGRAFAMHKTPTSRLAIFSHADNTDESRQPGRNGDWGNGHCPMGNTQKQGGGANFRTTDPLGRYTEQAHITFHHLRRQEETQTATQTFLPGGNIYDRAQQWDKTRDFNVEGKNSFQWDKIGLTSDTRFEYDQRHQDSELRTGEFNETPTDFGATATVLDSLFAPLPPPALLGITVNRTQQQTKGTHRLWEVEQNLSYYRELETGNHVFAKLTGLFHDEKGRMEDYYSQDFPLSGETGKQQHRHQGSGERKYGYEAYMTYGMHRLSHWHFVLTGTWQEHWTKGYNDIFLLHPTTDFLEGNKPATTKEEAWRDVNNSWRSDGHYRAAETALAINFRRRDLVAGRYTSLLLELPARYIWTTEKYFRGLQLSHVADHRWIFQPELQWEYDTRHFHDHYALRYSMKMLPPDLRLKVDFTDTSQPLRVLKGNPKLRASYEHIFDAYAHSRLGYNGRNELAFRTKISLLHDVIAMAMHYQQHTGTYIFQPVNVRGNWNAKSYLRLNRFCGTQQRWNIEWMSRLDFFHHVDLKSPTAGVPAVRSTVDQWVPSERLRLQYQCPTWKAELMGQVAWNIAKAHLQEPTNLHSLDFNYGVNLRWQLPWQLKLSTDIKMYSRRGYAERSLNDNHLVWNAQLDRTLCKGQLIVGLQAFDLLHQISQTRASVNALGRTEIWQQSLPHYLMLRLLWKFDSKRR